MSENQLELLEEKIKGAIQLISDLQAENNHLKMENAELSKKLLENEVTIQKLREQYNQYREHQIVSNSYKEKEEAIKQKVEGLLTKLDGLNQMLIE